MVVDPIVAARAKHLAGGSELFPLFVMAMIDAEGGMARIEKAVACSDPNVPSVEAAVDEACRTAAHRIIDKSLTEDAPAAVAEVGKYWAPVGVANDPNDLNVNWIPNVTKLYEQAVNDASA